MLRQTMRRVCAASNWPTRIRCRLKFDASTMTTTASPLRRASLMALRTMRASGVSSISS
jgi:hypothetical protein